MHKRYNIRCVLEAVFKPMMYKSAVLHLKHLTYLKCI